MQRLWASDRQRGGDTRWVWQSSPQKDTHYQKAEVSPGSDLDLVAGEETELAKVKYKGEIGKFYKEMEQAVKEHFDKIGTVEGHAVKVHKLGSLGHIVFGMEGFASGKENTDTTTTHERLVEKINWGTMVKFARPGQTDTYIQLHMSDSQQHFVHPGEYVWIEPDPKNDGQPLIVVGPKPTPTGGNTVQPKPKPVAPGPDKDPNAPKPNPQTATDRLGKAGETFTISVDGLRYRDTPTTKDKNNPTGIDNGTVLEIRPRVPFHEADGYTWVPVIVNGQDKWIASEKVGEKKYGVIKETTSASETPAEKATRLKEAADKAIADLDPSTVTKDNLDVAKTKLEAAKTAIKESKAADNAYTPDETKVTKFADKIKEIEEAETPDEVTFDVITDYEVAAGQTVEFNPNEIEPSNNAISMTTMVYDHEGNSVTPNSKGNYDLGAGEYTLKIHYDQNGESKVKDITLTVTETAETPAEVTFTLPTLSATADAPAEFDVKNVTFEGLPKGTEIAIGNITTTDGQFTEFKDLTTSSLTPGTYTITLIYLDPANDDTLLSHKVTLTVTEATETPTTPDFTFPATVSQGQEVDLNANDALAAGQTFVKWSIKEDGQDLFAESTDPEVTYQIPIAKAGDYIIQLHYTDTDGSEKTVDKSFTVEAPPAPTTPEFIDFPEAVEIGTKVNFAEHLSASSYGPISIDGFDRPDLITTDAAGNQTLDTALLPVGIHTIIVPFTDADGAEQTIEQELSITFTQAQIDALEQKVTDLETLIKNETDSEKKTAFEAKLAFTKKVLTAVNESSASFEYFNSDMKVTSASALEGLNGFSDIDLNFNYLTNLRHLKNLTNLTNLNLEYNNIGSINVLENLTNLTSLHLTSNNIKHINSLAGMTKMKELYLDYNLIEDISALTKLTQLEHLDLTYNPNLDLETTTTTLANFTQLTDLNLPKRFRPVYDDNGTLTSGAALPPVLQDRFENGTLTLSYDYEEVSPPTP